MAAVRCSSLGVPVIGARPVLSVLGSSWPDLGPQRCAGLQRASGRVMTDTMLPAWVESDHAVVCRGVQHVRLGAGNGRRRELAAGIAVVREGGPGRGVASRHDVRVAIPVGGVQRPPGRLVISGAQVIQCRMHRPRRRLAADPSAARHQGRCSARMSAIVRSRSGAPTPTAAPAAGTSALRSTCPAVTGRRPVPIQRALTELRRIGRGN